MEQESKNRPATDFQDSQHKLMGKGKYLQLVLEQLKINIIIFIFCLYIMRKRLKGILNIFWCNN